MCNKTRMYTYGALPAQVATLLSGYLSYKNAEISQTKKKRRLHTRHPRTLLTPEVNACSWIRVIWRGKNNEITKLLASP